MMCALLLMLTTATVPVLSLLGLQENHNKKLPSYDTFSIKITAFSTRGYLLPS